MKKNFLLLISTAFLFILTACSGNGVSDESIVSDTADISETSPEDSSADVNTENDKNPIEDAADNEILVAYFSATGNTEKVASQIITITGADTFEIEAAVPYTEEDLDYTNDSCRANQEQNDKTSRSEITGSIENMEDYDIVFLGYPIWWGEEPRIIDTFLESYDFSDKTVIPFCTSGGSDIGASEDNLHEITDSSVNWLPGKRFSTSDDSNTIEEWIAGLSIGEGG